MFNKGSLIFTYGYIGYKNFINVISRCDALFNEILKCTTKEFLEFFQKIRLKYDVSISYLYISFSVVQIPNGNLLKSSFQ